MTRISEKNITKKIPTIEDSVFGGDTENFGSIVRYDIEALATVIQQLNGRTCGDGFVSKISGENINSYMPIALVNNLAYKMDASNPLHQFAFAGFTEVSSTIGNPCKIKQIGEVTLGGWGLTPNQQYLAGINGTLITSNVSSSNFTKIIGYATTANTLQIIKDSITINK